MKLSRFVFKLLPATLKAIAIQSYHTLNGRRFVDLKKWISDNRGDRESNNFIVQESFNRLTNLNSLGRSPRLAIVSPTPPAETGIANYTIETYRHSEFEIDIYSSFSTNIDYLSTVYIAEIIRSRAKIYALDTLPYGRSINDYRAVVFTLGNSYHNLPYMLSLLSISKHSQDIRICIHLHDPFVLTLLRLTCEARGRNFVNDLEKSYGKLSIAERIRVESQDYSMLMERGISGVSALFSGIEIYTFIVNSSAGEKFIRADFENNLNQDSDFRVERIFLPILPPPALLSIIPAEPEHIRIGTFGIPDTAKRTEVVIEAFKLLRKIIPDAELLIAGYSADQYAEQSHLAAVEGIVILDSPNDLELQRAMRSCHLGIQLRQRNTGESSGIVPQLLANQVPVLVSQLGAFSEYGDAVGYVPVNADASQLLELILNELRIGGRRDEAISRLVKDHDPAHFCTRLLDLVSPSPLHLVLKAKMEEMRAQ
jgi:glycosyltransferase involved in cell wall biosynthesis